jgi:hypothetical protein
MRYWLAILVLIVALSPVAMGQSKEHAAPSDLNPGLWEVTVQMVEPLTGEPVTTEVCLSGDQGKFKAPKLKAKDNCQSSETPSPSNEIVYAVQCTKPKWSTAVKFAYFGDRYEGTMSTVMNGGDEVKMKYTAKRIGTCDLVADVPGK